MELRREVGLPTAVLIIIADVIGTGIFMTTGNVLGMTQSAPVVLALWGLGGIVALTGSLCYAELATMWPRDGGEYIYLKKIFGRLPSFLTGWVSLVVGFSASAAISAILVVIYLNQFFQSAFLSNPWAQKFLSSGIILFFGIFHIVGVKKGSFVQNGLTVLKLLIVFSFIAFGFFMADWGSAGRLTAEYAVSDKGSILKYGGALLVIMYAYSGWNGATYIAGEIKNPEKNLPKAMFIGILSISIIYFLLNIVFLISTPASGLMGKEAVGSIAAKNLFGESFSPIFTLGIALILLSSVSVQIMVGPRVYYAMAGDGMIFSSLKRVNKKYNTPDLAILIQVAITIIYVFIGIQNVIALLIYLGFALGIFPLMSVIGVIVMRRKHPNALRPFKVPLYPVVPLAYIILTLWMMITSLIASTKTSFFALLVVFAGMCAFALWRRFVNE